jgi:hypothetical protein
MAESQRTLYGRSHPLTSSTASDRNLQTAPSCFPNLDHRDLDGLEGPLVSGATGQITLGSWDQLPDSNPSISRIDPDLTSNRPISCLGSDHWQDALA